MSDKLYNRHPVCSEGAQEIHNIDFEKAVEYLYRGIGDEGRDNELDPFIDKFWSNLDSRARLGLKADELQWKVFKDYIAPLCSDGILTEEEFTGKIGEGGGLGLSIELFNNLKTTITKSGKTTDVVTRQSLLTYLKALNKKCSIKEKPVKKPNNTGTSKPSKAAKQAQPTTLKTWLETVTKFLKNHAGVILVVTVNDAKLTTIIKSHLIEHGIDPARVRMNVANHYHYGPKTNAKISKVDVLAPRGIAHAAH